MSTSRVRKVPKIYFFGKFLQKIGFEFLEKVGLFTFNNTVGQRDRQVQCRGTQTKPFEYMSIYLVALEKCVFKIWTKC